jgi:uncharacterized protein (TIGR02996 family)
MKELLERIVEDPDDLALRRVYADQLLAKGDPRGAFIQAQCSGARAMADELLLKHFKQWVLPIRPETADVTFERGFVEQWRCDAPAFIALGARVTRKTPLRRVVISDVRPRQLTALLTSPAFRGMREIELRGLREWCFYELAQSQFPRLRRLGLEGGPRGKQHALAGMLHQSWFAGVVELGLELPLLDGDLEALAGVLGQLEELNVNARLPEGKAPKLERLHLGHIRQDVTRLRRLLTEDAPRLRELRVYNCAVVTELVTAILDAPALEKLRLVHTIVKARDRALLEARFGPVDV